MRRAVLAAGIALGVAVLGGGPAHAGALADLLPNLFGQGGITLAPPQTGFSHAPHFVVNSEEELTVLNDSLRSQLTNLPLPSPASSFTFRFDPTVGTFTRTTDSFGPIYAQRAETTGRGKITLGFSYSRFTFDQVDGKDLDNGELQVTFLHEPTGSLVGRPTPFDFERDTITARIFADISSDVFLVSGTYGVLDNLDVSIAVPIIRNEIRLRGIATINRTGTAGDTQVHRFDATGTDTLAVNASDESTGIGDIVLRGKYNFLNANPVSLAAGLDIRLPTGSREDLRGIGTLRVSPTLIASTRPFFGVAPHLNVGVSLGDTTRLENEFFYAVGADWRIIPRLTLAFDILGRHVIDNERIEAGGPPGSRKIADSNIVDAAIGFKVNVYKNVLAVFNALVALNDTGLRDRVTPLFGIEIPF
jgi:hypothetical protein